MNPPTRRHYVDLHVAARGDSAYQWDERGYWTARVPLSGPIGQKMALAAAEQGRELSASVPKIALEVVAMSGASSPRRRTLRPSRLGWLVRKGERKGIAEVCGVLVQADLARWGLALATIHDDRELLVRVLPTPWFPVPMLGLRGDRWSMGIAPMYVAHAGSGASS